MEELMNDSQIQGIKHILVEDICFTTYNEHPQTRPLVHI